MPSLKDVQTKIQSVKKTKQITKAMNMVATSRLRGAQTAMDGFRPYAQKFAEVLGSLAEKAGEEASPLLVPKEEVKKIDVVLCTSDRGLCGGFNFNLINLAEEFVKERSVNSTKVSFTNFGKKGLGWTLKTGLQVRSKHLGVVGGKFGFSIASTVGKDLVDCFIEDELDELYVIYSQFISMTKQVPIIKKVLPIPPIESENDDGVDIGNSYQAEHICEPSPENLLADILPKSVYVQLYSALLETSTSEHAARLTAMDNATKACNDMIDSLTLAYNKARQAAITADLMDIVGGAEALR